METCLQIFKLKCVWGQSNRNIAVALCVSHSTIYEGLSRFKTAWLPWPLPETLTPNSWKKCCLPSVECGSQGLSRWTGCIPEMFQFSCQGMERLLFFDNYLLTDYCKTIIIKS